MFMHIRFFSFVFVLGCLMGCSNYKAGYPIDRTRLKTVFVLPAKTRALAAQMSGVLSQQMREMILRYGALKLAKTIEAADVVLETEITNYGRSIGTVDEYDTDVAKTLSLNASVKCSLYNHQGKVFFKDQSFSASININASDSAQLIEYQRMPQLTRELAQKIAMYIANLEVQ